LNDRYVSAGVIAACKELEAALLPLGCKPHWGKLHHMGLPTLTQQYGEEDMARFRALCAKSLFCAVLCLKTEHLPRQAQDKHRGNSRKNDVFLTDARRTIRRECFGTTGLSA
jgi:hypothetical protein